MRAGFAGVQMSAKMDAAREAYPKHPARRGGLRGAFFLSNIRELTAFTGQCYSVRHGASS